MLTNTSKIMNWLVTRAPRLISTTPRMGCGSETTHTTITSRTKHQLVGQCGHHGRGRGRRCAAGRGCAPRRCRRWLCARRRRRARALSAGGCCRSGSRRGGGRPRGGSRLDGRFLVGFGRLGGRRCRSDLLQVRRHLGVDDLERVLADARLVLRPSQPDRERARCHAEPSRDAAAVLDAHQRHFLDRHVRGELLLQHRALVHLFAYLRRQASRCECRSGQGQGQGQGQWRPRQQRTSTSPASPSSP